MNYFIKLVKHFHTVNKHRWYVFIYAVKAGIPVRGLLHDLSKYSFVEFFESVKYYDGHRSPITFARQDKGYSLAWLHHKGRNKHHLEYWEDVRKGERFGSFIPYPYIVECVCDKIAACKVYNGKNYSDNQPLDYWNTVDKNSPVQVHPGIVEFVDVVLKKIAKSGIHSALKKNYLKNEYEKVYQKYLKK